MFVGILWFWGYMVFGIIGFWNIMVLGILWVWGYYGYTEYFLAPHNTAEDYVTSSTTKQSSDIMIQRTVRKGGENATPKIESNLL